MKIDIFSGDIQVPTVTKNIILNLFTLFQKELKLFNPPMGHPQTPDFIHPYYFAITSKQSIMKNLNLPFARIKFFEIVFLDRVDFSTHWTLVIELIVAFTVVIYPLVIVAFTVVTAIE